MTVNLTGGHFSISGGIHKVFDRSDKYLCGAVQIFTQNSGTWKIKEITDREAELFKKRFLKSYATRVISHSSYLINLAGPEGEKREKSIKALKGELKRCSILGIEDLVIHPGSHKKTSVEEGIERVSSGLREVLEDDSFNVNILLETTAGQGDSVGHRLEHLETIIKKTDSSRIGICVDTCHVFAAGYDISTKKGYDLFFDDFLSRFAKEKLRCLHLNDSKHGCGSRKDRHEHLGLGQIGYKCFELLMKDERLADIPKIIELPGNADGKDMNKINFDLLKKSICSA